MQVYESFYLSLRVWVIDFLDVLGQESGFLVQGQGSYKEKENLRIFKFWYFMREKRNVGF